MPTSKPRLRRQHSRDSVIAYRNRKAADGLCQYGGCWDNAAPDRKHCPAHLEQNRLATQRRRNKVSLIAELVEELRERIDAVMAVTNLERSALLAMAEHPAQINIQWLTDTLEAADDYFVNPPPADRLPNDWHHGHPDAKEAIPTQDFSGVSTPAQ